MVSFDPVEHVYRNAKSERYISCSTIVGLYEEEFKTEFQLWCSALKIVDPEYNKNKVIYRALFMEDWIKSVIPNYINIKKVIEVKEELRKNWQKTNKDACDEGTAIHEKKELSALTTKKAFIKDREVDVLDWQEYVVNKTSVDYFKTLPDGYYTELRLWNHELSIAGTLDAVLIETNEIGERWISINDWKGFSLDTPIATKTGWVNIGDIKKGDIIFDGNGELTKVKNVSEVHHNPCFKITFDTNDVLVCDHEHKWVTTFRSITGNKLNDKTLTTEEIYNLYLTNPKIKAQIKCESLKLKDIELPLDPYILGLWIADGNRTCGSITCVNNNTWDEIKRRGFEIGINHNRDNGKAEARTILGISSILRGLNVIGNKHIPEIYYRSSHSQRMDLLRGFMDGDGHFHRKRKRCVMDTTKKWQADLTMELTSSLGMKPTIFNTKTSGFGKTDIPSWQVCFTPQENPFLTRNQDYNEVMKNVNFHRSNYRVIKKIEIVDTVPTKCLEVESKTHCYLAGKSFIKTHNTNKEFTTYNKYKQYLLHPIEHLQKSHLNIYTMQLSLYAYLLECMGFKVKFLMLTHIDKKTNVHKYHELSYRKQDVINMITHYHKNKHITKAEKEEIEYEAEKNKYVRLIGDGKDYKDVHLFDVIKKYFKLN